MLHNHSRTQKYTYVHTCSTITTSIYTQLISVLRFVFLTRHPSFHFIFFLSLVLPVSLVPSLPEYHFLLSVGVSFISSLCYNLFLPFSRSHSFPSLFPSLFPFPSVTLSSLIAFFPLSLYLSPPSSPISIYLPLFSKFPFLYYYFLFFSSLYQRI